MRKIKIYREPEKSLWKELAKRPQMESKVLRASVKKILDTVKAEGDEALKKFTEQFEGVSITDFKVEKSELALFKDPEPELKAAIQLAKANIETFHQAQIEREIGVETMPGVFCSRRAVPIERVGLYIPGGTAPLFSTLLMLAIPAKIAGCSEIIICTPPQKDERVHEVVLYAAKLVGVEKIFKVGGAQAIAAMAFGTNTIPAVDKIFGPGNQFVTCAKQLVNETGVAIDMPAGPSEVAVYADESCVPAFVAADLLSQAEHGPDSQVILVASDSDIAVQVQAEINHQIQFLERREIIAGCLQNSKFIVLNNAGAAFDFLNEYAPEHLIIASDNADELAHKVRNAGSVFLGNLSAESIGDYASGTNHTLPTYGFAKAYSGVSVDSFVKKITFQKISKTGLQNIGKAVEVMAKAEGLTAHSNAVTIRLNSYDR